MKAPALLAISASILIGCGGANTDTTAANADTLKVDAPAVAIYGDTISTEGAMAMAQFLTATAGKDSLDAKVECEIITSCQKKGCWMTVKTAGEEDMMVRFRDYGFFVPTEGLEGKKAVIQGHAVREITDVAALRHYAEDEGKTPEEIAKITEPDTSWTFTADGVIIRD